MSEFREVVEKILKEGGLQRTKRVLTSDDFASCLITAYQSLDGKTEEEKTLLRKQYDKDNKELANTARRIGYGVKPTTGGFWYDNGTAASEPGFRISFRPKSIKEVEDFKQEMIELGVKYNQYSILLKLPHEKPMYVFTNPEQGIGKKDIEFNSLHDTTTKDFKYGYTQMRKDYLKGREDRAFEFSTDVQESAIKLLEFTQDELDNIKEKQYSCSRNTIRGLERQKLGFKY